MTQSDQSNCQRPEASPLYAYNKGCRCERCVTRMRAWKARWRARTGAERRVGRRAEQKRAYDEKRKVAR